MSVAAILYGMEYRHRHCIAMAQGNLAAKAQMVHNLRAGSGKTGRVCNQPVMEDPPAGDKKPLHNLVVRGKANWSGGQNGSG
jgi:hypothetical protein